MLRSHLGRWDPSALQDVLKDIRQDIDALTYSFLNLSEDRSRYATKDGLQTKAPKNSLA